MLYDFENLSRLKVESSDHANSFDYSNIVVNKPWGYEYLWFQNDFVAIWFLFIDSSQKTSMHCHAKKRTSLVVLDGQIECRTIDNRFHLSLLDTVVLEPCVFHSSLSSASNGSILLEIETPPMKGDLVRMNDAYGRQKTAYEKTSEYSTDLSRFDYQPFTPDTFQNWEYKNARINLVTNLDENIQEDSIIIPILGPIELNGKTIIESGEAFRISDIRSFNISEFSENSYLVFYNKRT